MVIVIIFGIKGNVSKQMQLIIGKKNIMKHYVVLALLWGCSQALDCNIHMKNNEGIKDVISKCIKTNHTLEDLWNMAPMSSESDSSSLEETPSTLDTKMAQIFRSRRAATTTKTTPPTSQDNSSSTDSSQTTTVPSSEEGLGENCITQCIFSQLEMTDNNGYPLHGKMVEGLMRNASGRELRDFIQETTDECFQETDKENSLDSCSYSQKLVECLAEKGKANCADWPVGELPFST